MPLNDARIRALKPRGKPHFAHDSLGLRLLISPTGSKLWRFNYLYQGRHKTISLGRYPEVGLAQARKRRDEARSLLAEGVDPSAARQQAKAPRPTFASVAAEWLATQANAVDPKTHATRVKRFELHLFPSIGNVPIAELSGPQLLTPLRRLEVQGKTHVARRVLQLARRAFAYGVATGACERNPAADIGSVLAPHHTKHRPAILDPQQLGGLLRSIDGYGGEPTTRVALQLLPMLLCRPGELRRMEWSEVEGDLWTLPAAKTKQRRDHLVPLPRQAVQLLDSLRGHSRFVFPSPRSSQRPISDVTLSAALRRMGYSNAQVVPHGFRATSRTLLEEHLGVDPVLIEHQLGHSLTNPLGRAYARTTLLAQRREMLQQWADWLTALLAQVTSVC